MDTLKQLGPTAILLVLAVLGMWCLRKIRRGLRRTIGYGVASENKRKRKSRFGRVSVVPQVNQKVRRQ